MAGRFTFSLCADDFALSPGVSEGILTALEAKRLSATSVMTTQSGWPAAAKALRAFDGAADIGLHLNLSLGTPLTPMPRFAPDKSLPKISRIIGLARQGHLPEAEIRTEIAAQIEAFEAHYGKAPDFADGHQHVQILPGIQHWLLETLEQKGLKGRVWIRDSGDKAKAILRRGRELKKAFAVTWLGRGFAHVARTHGFATNEGFAGFSRFDPEDDYRVAFETYLKAPGPAHLIMCHPGYVDKELASLDSVVHTRPQELAFLLSSQFEDLLGRRGAELTRLQVGCPQI
jgi:predicted glycoside hydrolase/deacetylase ChbG (UPF0249 family)